MQAKIFVIIRSLPVQLPVMTLLPYSCEASDAKLDMHNGMLSQMLSLGKCIGRQKIEVQVVSLLCDLFLEICILPIYGFTWHFVDKSDTLLPSRDACIKCRYGM